MREGRPRLREARRGGPAQSAWDAASAVSAPRARSATRHASIACSRAVNSAVTSANVASLGETKGGAGGRPFRRAPVPFSQRHGVPGIRRSVGRCALRQVGGKTRGLLQTGHLADPCVGDGVGRTDVAFEGEGQRLPPGIGVLAGFVRGRGKRAGVDQLPASVANGAGVEQRGLVRQGPFANAGKGSLPLGSLRSQTVTLLRDLDQPGLCVGKRFGRPSEGSGCGRQQGGKVRCGSGPPRHALQGGPFLGLGLAGRFGQIRRVAHRVRGPAGSPPATVPIYPVAALPRRPHRRRAR